MLIRILEKIQFAKQLPDLCIPIFFVNTFDYFIPTTRFAGSALKCYECNSHNDSRCAQEEPPQLLGKDCSTHQNAAHKYTLCRKIVQTIEYEVNGREYFVLIYFQIAYQTSNSPQTQARERKDQPIGDVPQQFSEIKKILSLCTKPNLYLFYVKWGLLSFEGPKSVREVRLK